MSIKWEPVFVMYSFNWLQNLSITPLRMSLVKVSTSQQILVFSSSISCTLWGIFFFYPHRKNSGAVKFSDHRGHKISPNLEIRHLGNNLQQCNANKDAYLMDLILKITFFNCLIQWWNNDFLVLQINTLFIFI